MGIDLPFLISDLRWGATLSHVQTAQSMNPLPLHEFHHTLGAQFGEVNGTEVVARYGEPVAEYTALQQTAGVLDLSHRSRICLTGVDRARFLHGQVTNDVNRLRTGEGCYAAITTAKGKMESDLNIYALADELLLDFEPGLTEKITGRLEKFLVADDVQIVEVAALYGLLSVQGPKANDVIKALGIFAELPAKPFQSVKVSDSMLGEIYLIAIDRTAFSGFDLFVPTDSLGAVVDKLIAAAKSIGGRACGWDALEIARIEAGIPRYGADMDESNIPLECGIEARAISYQKGCYIGQEVINRIHSIGHVNKELRCLRLEGAASVVPTKGDKFFHDGKEAGYLTSAAKSPVTDAILALGYVRREALKADAFTLQSAAGEIKITLNASPLPS